MRNFCKRLSKCGGTQRSLRKRLGKCCGTCAACANVSANAVVLARLAQTSRQMPRNLRSLRKRLGKCWEPRAACANVSANAAELAPSAQTSRQMPRNLRGLRKRGVVGGRMLLRPYSLTANCFNDRHEKVLYTEIAACTVLPGRLRFPHTCMMVRITLRRASPIRGSFFSSS